MVAMQVTLSCRSQDRFWDLLEHFEDEEDDSKGLVPSSFRLSGFILRQESSHGPLDWNTRRGAELQSLVDGVNLDGLCHLGFSITVADPSQPDCPLVACSAGFTELTGYSVQEIVGRNCRFLLNGVPQNLIDDGTRMRCRSLCMDSSQGREYTGEGHQLPAGLQKPFFRLPKGEMICVQTNARKSGELFRNMFYLKQVQLDEKHFILGLQAGLPEEFDLNMSLHDLENSCQLALFQLEENMTMMEHILAKEFWYSAPMRRQN